MDGVDGRVPVAVTNIDTVRIGTATRRNWHMLVLGEQDFGNDVAVILGDDFFQRADIEFDHPRRVVRMFHPGPECAGESLAYWGAASVVPMGPVERRPRILVPVHINGKPFWAVLDSGAVLTQLDVTTAAEVGVTPDTPGVTVAGTTSGLRSSEAITWLGAFESFVIGDESVARPNLLFGELGLRRSLLLGADFLLKHRVLIAHSQRKVYFSYVGAAEGEPSSGPATDAAPKGDLTLNGTARRLASARRRAARTQRALPRPPSRAPRGRSRAAARSERRCRACPWTGCRARAAGRRRRGR
jgi:predicted aspartyl protease